MRRLAFALAALVFLANGASASWQPSWRPPEWLWLAPAAAFGALIPFIPLAQATEQEAVGFADGPYGDEAGYLQGHKPWALALTGSSQRAQPSGRAVSRASARLDTAKRMGVDLNWTGFPDDELRDRHGTEYWTAHMLGNISEAPNQVVDWGVGLATLRGDTTLWGGSVEANYETYPMRPLFVQARYQLGILQDRRGYHDLSAQVGVAFTRFGLSVGWRAFFNPRRASHGPEAALRVWL